MNDYGVKISSVFYSGRTCQVNFLEEGTNITYNLGTQVIPFTFYPLDGTPQGQYFIYFSGTDQTFVVDVFQPNPSPTPTSTVTPTPTTTVTPTVTPTSTVTPTTTQTPTPTVTDTPTSTPTPTVTDTPTSTPTPTVTDTPTSTPTPTVTDTPTSTPTPTVTDTPTSTPTPTVTDTPTNTPTPTFTNTPTSTPTPTVTDTPTPTVTPTNTNTPTPSSTPGYVTAGLQTYFSPESYVGSGSTWSSSVGSTSTTLYGSPLYNSDSGFTFNGVSQYARIPSVVGVTDFTNTNTYSVEIWFNSSSPQPSLTLATILEKWNQNNQSRYPYVFRYSEAASTLSIGVYDGVNNPTTNITGVNINTWYQIVGVFDFVSKTLKVYKNGVLQNSVSLVGVNQISNTSPVGIAHRIAVGGATQFMFKGTIGIIRIYNSVLSDAQVLQNFNSNKNQFGI